MPDPMVHPVCPTLLFGQFECALRDNDFVEAERLKVELEQLGIRVQIEFWPQTADADVAGNEEVTPC